MKRIARPAILSIAFSIICIFSVVPDIFSQDSSQCMAVITGKKGNVTLKKAGGNEFLKAEWGTQLFRGDQIRTESGSEVSLTFTDGNVHTLGSGGTMTLGAGNNTATSNSENVKKVTAGMMSNMSALTGKRIEKKDFGALAGLRSVAVEDPIELISPYNTLIKSDRPTFVWFPKKPYERFVVNLYNSKGLVWSNKVADNSMRFPDKEKSLQPGETYFWNVEGEDLIDNKKSSSYSFSVLPPDKSKEVIDQEQLIRSTFKDDNDSSSLHSFLGAYYMNQGLMEDAIREFEIISRMNPGAPLPHEILGSLYSDTGQKDKAIEELQKALALSKAKKE